MPFAWATSTYIRSKYGSAHLSPAAPKVSEQDVKSERAAWAPWGGGRCHEMVRGKSPWSCYLQWAPNPTGPLRLIHLQNDSRQSGTADDQQVKPPCAMSHGLHRADWKPAGSLRCDWLLTRTLWCLTLTGFSYLKGALVMQPVSTVGFSDNKCFIFCRVSHAFHNPGDLFFMIGWLAPPRLSLIRYCWDNTGKTLIDPMGMTAYSKGNKQTKQKQTTWGRITLNLREK